MYLGLVKLTPDISTSIGSHRTILLTAAVFGLLAVLLGTFGAHGVEQKVPLNDYRNYEKASQYHYIFMLMQFATALLSLMFHSRKFHGPFWFFTAGIVLFSGSLYFIATRAIHQADFPRFVFLVTPLGGLCFVTGWFWLLALFAGIRSTKP